MDWKDALSAISGLPEGPDAESPAENDTAVSGRVKSPALHITVEKKGRGGKTATIVDGFDCSDEEVESVARDIRKRLGAGGSSRGGEILIQGDRREDVGRLLRDLGFKVK